MKKKTRHRQPKSTEGKITLALPPSGHDDKNSAREEPIKRKRKSRAEIQVPHHETFMITTSICLLHNIAYFLILELIINTILHLYLYLYT